MHNYTEQKWQAESPKEKADSDFARTRAGQMRSTCSIVGARGYSGLELARLLLQHPYAKLENCFATSEFSLHKHLHNPAAKDVLCMNDSQIMYHLSDVNFLATPAEVSLELAPKILAAGKSVIDLSGAFRLKDNDYKKWYNFEHTSKETLALAQYGLAPLAGPTNSKMIANPGCYASAISLALIPVLKHNLVDASRIVIDAKSGTSGAGKKAAENLLFTEVEGDCLPYKVGKHQHLPEIQETIRNFAGVHIEPHFSTALLPVRRGIIAAMYLELTASASEADVIQAFANTYQDYPLLSFGKATQEPQLLSLRKVVGTNKTNISYVLEGRKLYLFSCIDNLIKGAAGQAVENLNRIIDCPLETGLANLEALT